MTLAPAFAFLVAVLALVVVSALFVTLLELVRVKATMAMAARHADTVAASEQEWKARAEMLMDQHLVRSGVSPVLHPPTSPSTEHSLAHVMRAFGTREIDSTPKRKGPN